MDSATRHGGGRNPARTRALARAGACASAALAAALLAAPAAAAPTSTVAADAADEVIVRFRDGATDRDRSQARRDAGAALEATLPVDGVQLLDLGKPRDVDRAIERLERDPQVLYAEPNALRTASWMPGDTSFGELWGLHNTGQAVNRSTGTADADVDAPEAWDVTTGSPGVKVAVVDTGVAAGHADLAPNLAAGGYDWVDDDSDPADRNGHGTHVAGTVAARAGNGYGVSGVAPSAAHLPLRVLDASGNGTVSDAIAAYAHAARAGARIVNLSLGGASFSAAERDAIASAPNTLFVVAAGNGGSDGAGDDVDGSAAEYPCAYGAANIVCVAASDQNDALASFSNYGASSVDLAAPGRRIYSTVPAGMAAYGGADLAFMSGTSMAAPHVAGAAALVMSAYPTLSTGQVRSALLAGVDARPAFSGRTATGGRLNALGALRAAAGLAGSPDPAGGGATPESAPAAGAGAPAADLLPPGVALATAARQRRSLVLRRGVRSAVRCSENCTVAFEATVSAATARSSGLSARSPVVGRARVSLRAGSTRAVGVRLSSRARRALARRSTTRVTVRAVASDAAGNRRRISRRTVVRR